MDTETEYYQTTTRNISSIDTLSDTERISLIQTYQKAFELAPYYERFSEEDVELTFNDISSKNGDIVIVLGENEQVRSLCAGFLQRNGVYWIEELATDPSFQRRGFGTTALSELEKIAENQGATAIELRTTIGNSKALRIYETAGFIDTGERVLVTQQRVDGRPEIDERMFLRKNIIEKNLQEQQLRSVVIAYPSGNPTALVLDQGYEDKAQELNDGLMKKFPMVEQGGFLLPATLENCIGRVRMFGGEFCGNAARSAVWVLTQGIPGRGNLEFEIDGVSKVLAYDVDQTGEVTVEMPLPDQNVVEKRTDGILVKLDGISQLVVEYNPGENLNPEELKSRARTILSRNKLLKEPASGVVFYSKTLGTIEPVVWVRDIETYFYETACGSGTCAVGIAEASSQNNSVEIEVNQPSGEIITVSAEQDNKGKYIANISGNVGILYNGSFKFEKTYNE